MSKIDKIDNVLNPVFKWMNNELTEEQASMSIKLIPGNCRYIIFQLDKSLGRQYRGGIFPFFNSSNEKVCTVCDYIIFAEFKKSLYALIIELKTSDQNTLRQLNAGECFVDFVISTVNRVNNTNFSINKRKITIKEFKRKRKPKLQDISYDNNYHHFFEQDKLRIISYLK